MIITTTKQLRSRDSTDHYPTPTELCKAAIGVIPLEYPIYVLDPGAGAGVWGDAVRNRWRFASIYGVEADHKWDKPLVYGQWYQEDFLNSDLLHGSFDLVCGNPPYGINANGVKDRNLAEKFVKKSFELVKEGGYIVFLLRLGFLEGQRRAEKFWPVYPAKEVYVLSRRPSFTNDQRTDATAYGLFVWQRGYVGSTELKWLHWNYDNTEVSGHQA